MLRRVSLGVALGALVVSVAVPQPAAQSPSVTLFVGVTPRVTLHEPIELRFVMRNDRSDAVYIDFGKNGIGHFQLTHVKPNGLTSSVDLRNPSPEALARGHEVWSSGERRIVAKGRYEGEILLDDWLDFSAVGIHQLRVQFSGPVATPSQLPLEISRASTFTVTVLQRDVVALRAACERLVREIQTTVDGQEAFKAAKKLALVNDPVAVPFLLRAIEGPKPVYIEDIPIRALERIGTQEAKDALLKVGNTNKDVDTARAARSALARLDTKPR